MTTNTNLPGVLEAQIKTLTDRLTRHQGYVEAAESELANARDMRDDTRAELARAMRTLIARGSEDYMGSGVTLEDGFCNKCGYMGKCRKTKIGLEHDGCPYMAAPVRPV